MTTPYQKYKLYQQEYQKRHRQQLNEYHSKKYHEQIKYNDQYLCTTCNVNLIYRLNYKKHLQTAKHKRNQKIIEDEILKEEQHKRDSYYHDLIIQMINSKY